MIHLDEVRPVYQNGGDNPKGKKKVKTQYNPLSPMEVTKRALAEYNDRVNGVQSTYIPTPIKQVGIYNYATNYNRTWGTGTGQKDLNNRWILADRPNKRGLATYNDRYLVAMSNKFGNVGDDVDIILNNNDTIRATIADIKNEKDPNYTQYGHYYDERKRYGSRYPYGISIVEFENYGGPVDLGSWKGQTVHKVNNLSKVKRK